MPSTEGGSGRSCARQKTIKSVRGTKRDERRMTEDGRPNKGNDSPLLACSLLPAPCTLLLAPCSLLLAPCSLLTHRILAIHTATSKNIDASMMANAQGWTAPKAKGVKRTRNSIPPVMMRSHHRFMILSKRAPSMELGANNKKLSLAV